MERLILSEFYGITFFLQNSFLAILMLISQKLVQRRGIGEKCVNKGLSRKLIASETYFLKYPTRASVLALAKSIRHVSE